MRITSVHRTVKDQANTFYNKHIVKSIEAKYKHPDVPKIIKHAQTLYAEQKSPEVIKKYLIGAIEHAHGGPFAISHHIGLHPFLEVFDVGHYSLLPNKKDRHYYMTDPQAKAFLEGCRKRIDYPIARIGHSAELGFKLSRNVEFADEMCFHLEVRLPIFDKLEDHANTRVV